MASAPCNFHFPLIIILFLSLQYPQPLVVDGAHDYRAALEKALLFFQGHRSGSLNGVRQDLAWRGDSGLTDGQSEHVNLTGGYYDAGDNVKFNLPMAFTATMLSWSIIDYGKRLGPQLSAARVAVRWATDYLLKCATARPGTLFAGVGDPNKDHACWERPEDMDTDRTAYYVSASKPGSDVAGETAAALAAASVVFRKADPSYSKKLQETAESVMDFANKYRGAYSDSLSPFVCPFYCSYSGYMDELGWGAAWLYRATKDDKYLKMYESFNINDSPNIFSWDNKFAGTYVLLARRSLVNKDPKFNAMNAKAQEFICNILPGSSTQYTPGGLIYKIDGTNLQYVTAITALVTTYAKYMSATHSHTSFKCADRTVTATVLRDLARKQIDYILGDNPMRMSYMVGYGPNFPRKIHHRGSSMPSIHVYRSHINCNDGFQYKDSPKPNPNELTGAIVGGPDSSDRFNDDRNNYGQTEPATYVNAAAIGTLAYFAGAKAK
ncbi:Endoglucanase 9 [Striga hermonthica]|uniref:Endoglucanase n=1 Tax=Striga hermonthica TaxID=68872 RepID=A0A9N7NTG8_STRHE|nr:Endoglucanase 9 [Striga hermonthica]